MYPDLSYFFHDLIGTDRDNWLSIFKTYGFFLLMAFIVAAQLLRIELKRREKMGQFTGITTLMQPGAGLSTFDYIFNTLLGFALGYKLPYAIAKIDEWKGNPESVLLNSEGWLVTGLLGGLLFFGYYYWIDRRSKQKMPEPMQIDIYPSDRIAPITFAAAIGGLVGAKVFAIIEYLPAFFEDPIGTFFSGSGLAIYGGLIGGFVTVYWYLHRYNIPKLPLMDAVAPALMIAYGIGRMGCQFSGDGDWGIIAAAQPEWWFFPDWLWAYDYPNNVVDGGGAAVEQIAGCTDRYCTRLAEGHYPTPVYETTAAFGIGWLLWSLRKKLAHLPGMLFAVYLIFNGIERFLIEYVRVNDQYDVLGLQLTQAQLIAIGFVVSGAVMATWVWNNRANSDSSPVQDPE
ncbi:MAG: prolipoprotein diacylglyceryl transferase family protein [Bacteroidota bacterium]